MQKHFMDQHQLGRNKREGFIALLTVLVLGAIGVAAAISLLLFGLGASRTGLALEESGEARVLAGACAEEALQQIRNDVSFSGSGLLSLNGGTCSYSVTVETGQNRLINTTGTSGSAVRKIFIQLDRVTPKIHASSSQEVP